jgi:hypothetical protein
MHNNILINSFAATDLETGNLDRNRFAQLIIEDCVQTLINHGYTDAATCLEHEHLVQTLAWKKLNFPEI